MSAQHARVHTCFILTHLAFQELDFQKLRPGKSPHPAIHRSFLHPTVNPPQPLISPPLSRIPPCRGENKRELAPNEEAEVGKLACGNPSCRQKLGGFSWHGLPCSCGHPHDSGQGRIGGSSGRKGGGACGLCMLHAGAGRVEAKGSNGLWARRGTEA